MLGGCAGFLWWNAHPAKIFMGDTGSLAIGAALAGLALTLNTILLLPIIGALFVVETVSVIIQVFSFRVFGRRVFRMAPDPPPLRAARLARDHRDRPLLDHRRPGHRAGARHVLRRLHHAAGAAHAMTAPAERSALVPQHALVLGLGVTGRAVVRALRAAGLHGHRHRRPRRHRRPGRGPPRLGATWVDPPGDWAAAWWPATTAWCPAPASPSATRSSPPRSPPASRCAASSTWPPRGTTAPGRRHHRHQRQDHRHHPGHRHARWPPGSPRSPPATPRCRSSRRSTTPPPRCSWSRRRRSGSRSPPATGPSPPPGSTSRPTTSTCTSTSPATRRPRPGSGPTTPTAALAVANADDPVVMRWAPAGERTQTFGSRSSRPTGTSPTAGSSVPAASTCSPSTSCTRSLPHDCSQRPRRRGHRPGRRGHARRRPTALSAPFAASPIGSSWWARLVGCAGTTTPRPPRPTPRWPRCRASPRPCSSPAAATRASTWPTLGALAPHLRAVVAIGEAAAEVEAAFAGARRRSSPPRSMDDAVDVGRRPRRAPATPSCCRPACASFDWYRVLRRARRRLPAGRARAPGAGVVTTTLGHPALPGPHRPPGQARRRRSPGRPRRGHRRLLAPRRHRHRAQHVRPGHGHVGLVGASVRAGGGAVVAVRAPGAVDRARHRRPARHFLVSVEFWRRFAKVVPAGRPSACSCWCSCPGVGVSANGATRWLGAGPVPGPAVGVRQVRPAAVRGRPARPPRRPDPRLAVVPGARWWPTWRWWPG